MSELLAGLWRPEPLGSHRSGGEWMKTGMERVLSDSGRFLVSHTIHGFPANQEMVPAGGRLQTLGQHSISRPLGREEASLICL